MKEWIISGDFHVFLGAMTILFLGAMIGLTLPEKLSSVSMTEILVSIIYLLIMIAAVAGIIYKDEINDFKSKEESCQNYHRNPQGSNSKSS